MSRVPIRLNHPKSCVSFNNEPVNIRVVITFDNGQWHIASDDDSRRSQVITHEQARFVTDMLFNVMEADVVMKNYLGYCEARESWLRRELEQKTRDLQAELIDAVSQRQKAETKVDNARAN